MRLFRSPEQQLDAVLGQARLRADRDRGYVTLGVFDGVHLGHQRLIRRMVESARADGGTALTLTFHPHPSTVLRDEPLHLLTTVDERAALIAPLGVDRLIVTPFTHDVARMAADAFLAHLERYLALAELWIGSDFTLGCHQEGDADRLHVLGQERGFAVHVVEPRQWRGEAVSSSRIREALVEGQLEEANGCLGRPYRLSGVVVHGEGRGRKLGVPTANLLCPAERLIPASGIYASRVHGEALEGYPTVVNVGTRPTFEGREVTVEAHLLGFEDNLYGQTLALDFIERLRDEEAFDSVDALIAQMDDDIKWACEVLGEPSACATRR